MKEEQKRFFSSLLIPGICVLIMWLVKVFETLTGTDLEVYGLIPLSWQGLPGIIIAPFLHANFSHLAGNTLPFIVLGGLLFYFYRSIAFKIFWLIWLITGLWVWAFAQRNSIHVGASGVINGLAAFLFLSGILRRDSRLMAITLLIAFLYGGLVWGIFPQLFPHQPISWESHLMGLLAGILLAIYYRNSGPQREVYRWEDDEDDDDEQGPDNTGSSDETIINYEYKE
jgi:membrane associated rhomboid family serine protease